MILREPADLKLIEQKNGSKRMDQLARTSSSPMALVICMYNAKITHYVLLLVITPDSHNPQTNGSLLCQQVCMRHHDCTPHPMINEIGTN